MFCHQLRVHPYFPHGLNVCSATQISGNGKNIVEIHIQLHKFGFMNMEYSGYKEMHLSEESIMNPSPVISVSTSPIPSLQCIEDFRISGPSKKSWKSTQNVFFSHFIFVFNTFPSFHYSFPYPCLLIASNLHKINIQNIALFL